MQLVQRAWRVGRPDPTSLMLIAAAPALVTGWPVAKMPLTGFVMNLCVFRAVAVGPTVGGLQASAGQWRPLFWGVAGVAALALLFAVLTFSTSPSTRLCRSGSSPPRFPLSAS